MNKQNNLKILVFCIICLIAYGLIWYVKAYQPKYNWSDNYSYTSNEPYGLKLFFDILSTNQSKENFKLITKDPYEILEKEDSSALYICVGNVVDFDSIDSQRITKFVHRGNNVFISGVKLNHFLFGNLTHEKYPTIDYQSFDDSIVHVSFDTLPEHQFMFEHQFGKKLTEFTWIGWDSIRVADSLRQFGFERVSDISHGIDDCIRVKYGKGWFIFHHNPMFFTNYNLSKENGLSYINHLLTPYKKNRILWDEYSKPQNFKNHGAQSHETPLKFILSDRSLRWAWYLLCIFVLLFVIFNSKRKQAYIPLLPENKNMTMEYINSMAILHYQSNSASFTADEILRQFLSFVKHKYGVSPNLKKKEIAELLAPLSGIPEETLNNLFKFYMGVKYSTQVENNDLLEFYRLTEYFYQNCK